MPAKTTLILGAGASANYGFPVGKDLRTKILDLRAGRDRAAVLYGESPDTIGRFVDAFERAQTYSIDAFLGRRLEFENVGKSAIAHVILGAEVGSRVRVDRGDHWYQYLINTIARDEWDALDLRWLSVVTFNYDRSLEAFLLDALANMYGKSLEQVSEKLREIEIVHVYGSLGSPWKAEEDHMPYPVLGDGMGIAIRQARGRLRVVPEGRDSDPTIQAARRLIRNAKHVCVLGFGFDELNVVRLGGKESFVDANGSPKHVVATAIGLTKAEAAKAAGQLWGRPDMQKLLVDDFHDCNCLQLLRETLVLG